MKPALEQYIFGEYQEDLIIHDHQDQVWKFSNRPQSYNNIEITERKLSEISVIHNDFKVSHKETRFVQVKGMCIIILLEKETEKNETIQGPKRD